MNTKDIERFWAKVEKSPDGCWMWQGSTNLDGYGQITIDGKNQLAHRVSWEICYGEIPTGMFICHHCDVPGCIRPDHLFSGTNLDNMLDAMQKGRLASGIRNGTYTHPESRPRGERNGKVRLTCEQVAAIKSEFKNGANARNLATYFGVCRDYIYMIVRGKRRQYD